VDFLLLGGDLFDEVNPSQECFFNCLKIMKENVFGGKNSHCPPLHVSMNG
jgi:DNA repair exonuclease SbcCD nuclease subunit